MRVETVAVDPLQYSTLVITGTATFNDATSQFLRHFDPVPPADFARLPRRMTTFVKLPRITHLKDVFYISGSKSNFRMHINKRETTQTLIKMYRADPKAELHIYANNKREEDIPSFGSQISLFIDYYFVSRMRGQVPDDFDATLGAKVWAHLQRVFCSEYHLLVWSNFPANIRYWPLNAWREEDEWQIWRNIDGMFGYIMPISHPTMEQMKRLSETGF
jgi:hypothetical protein